MVIYMNTEKLEAIEALIMQGIRDQDVLDATIRATKAVIGQRVVAMKAAKAELVAARAANPRPPGIAGMLPIPAVNDLIPGIREAEERVFRAGEVLRALHIIRL
jgi:hypothetical protein